MNMVIVVIATALFAETNGVAPSGVLLPVGKAWEPADQS